jgi:3D (Asp-Asp-Asp) domain-containing protein
MRKIALYCLLGMVVGFLGWPQPTMSVSMSIVTVTAYYPRVYCKHTPVGYTTSGVKVAEGMLAVSRDVEKNLNLRFGDRVMLHGMGVFAFQDRMHPRMKNKVDVFMKSKRKAVLFGVKRHVVLVKMT